MEDLNNQTLNNQAKSEVKELFNEYVVSPVNEDVKKQLQLIIGQIDEKVKELNDSSEQKCHSIRGRIVRLNTDLNESFDEKNDNITNQINKLNTDLVNKIKDDVYSMSFEISKNTNHIDGQIKRCHEDTIQSISDNTDKLTELADKLAALNQLCVISKNEQTAVLQEKANILQENIKAIEKQIGQMYVEEQAINGAMAKNIQELNEKIESVASSVSSTYMEKMNQQETKFKSSFWIVLSIGILNFLGIVSLLGYLCL